MKTRTLVLTFALFLLPAPGSAQPRWVQPNPAVSPPPRFGHAMSWDGARGRTVLFGGVAGGDVWEWDGAAWTQSSPPGGPFGRNYSGLVWDSRRQRTVLFGGYGLMSYPLDTWDWDGTGWQVAPVVGPSGRAAAAMSFDSGRGVTVLFGGFAGFGGFVTDTWEYDGTSWTQRMPPQAPPGRLYTAAAYDANRRRTVLFGGQDQAMVQLGDTWEYDGLTWTQITPPVAPSGRSGHSMVYDPLRRRVVLFGGSGGPAETWEYDGTAWTFVSLNPTPSPRTLHAMALDAGRGTGVLFGGWIGTNPGLGDTWELAPPACETIGPGHPGGGLAFACTTPPRVGTTFCVSWSYPPPGGVGYGLLLVAAGPGLDPPLALGPPLLCATGQLYAWPATIVPILGEPASWCVPLPAAPGLVGQAAALQGASLDAANCFRLTDGLRVWLQP